MKKNILKIIMMILICLVSMQMSSVSKASELVDVSPPWARLSIVGATESGGINYISTKNIEIEIYAHDDTCLDSEIEYYISETPIDNTVPLDENLWQQYAPGLKINYTLPSLTSTNVLYAIFRDKVGNTSLIYEGPEVEYTINYHANGGEGTIASGIGYHGMAYIVTSQVPKRENYYFLGWSTSSTATTASYEQGDIILAEAFNGSNKVIDLYAIWTENKANLTLLADKVSIGDYVDYPVYYENLAVGANLTTKKGWRVISKNIDLDGNDSPGTVNLVSAGVPLTFCHAGNGEASVTALTTNFLFTEFDEFAAPQKYVENGFIGYLNLSDVFNNKYTAMNGTTPKVRSIVEEDILRVTGDTEILKGNLNNLVHIKYAELFNVGEHYWIAKSGGGVLWNIEANGTVAYRYGDSYGVRPVVSLKSTVKASKQDIQGRWLIEL